MRYHRSYVQRTYIHQLDSPRKPTRRTEVGQVGSTGAAFRIHWAKPRPSYPIILINNTRELQAMPTLLPEKKRKTCPSHTKGNNTSRVLPLTHWRIKELGCEETESYIYMPVTAWFLFHGVMNNEEGDVEKTKEHEQGRRICNSMLSVRCCCSGIISFCLSAPPLSVCRPPE